MDQEEKSGAKNVGVSISGGQVEAQGDIVGGNKYVYEAPVPVVASLHQLPPPPEDFTGREDELKSLRATIVAGGTTIWGLTGQGGVGKTALALKLADEIKQQFPDAQIYLDLLGMSEKPVTEGEAMAYVIRAFHPQARLQEKERELGGIFRSVLEGKRALLLMDNAKDAGQVKSLIPPKGCCLLVTSRARFSLPGLYSKDLNTLPLPKAEEFLLKIARRIGGEAHAIARLCGCLPQALRLAASALAERVDLDPAYYAKRLAAEENRPKLLAAGNESVEASINLSYALLDAETQKRWRMLGVFPDTFDPPAAGVMWQLHGDPVQDTLGRLFQYSMLEWNEETKRYRLHDLVRDFSRKKMVADERNDVSRRHAAHYLTGLRVAGNLYLQGAELLMRSLALVDIERGNILAGQAWAAAHVTSDTEAARMCSAYADAGAPCLRLRQHPLERIQWLEAALSAARLLRERGAEASHLGRLGMTYFELGETRRAIGYYDQCLATARQVGDRRLEYSALGNLGVAYGELGDTRKAVEHFEWVLAIDREMGDRRMEGRSLGNLGATYLALGETQRALEYVGRWLSIARETGDRIDEGKALLNLGIANAQLSEMHRAIKCFEQSLAITRETGDRRAEGHVCSNLGRAYCNLGTERRGVEYLLQAVMINKEIGDRRDEAGNLFCAGMALVMLDNRETAVEFGEAALTIFEEIEDPDAEKVRKALEEWRRQ